MKRLLLWGVVITQTMLPIRVTVRANHRAPAPVNRHVDTLKSWVPNPYVRLGIAGAAFGIAATENPIRRSFLKLVKSAQRVFNRANQVVSEAHWLEDNVRAWGDSLKRVF